MKRLLLFAALLFAAAPGLAQTLTFPSEAVGLNANLPATCSVPQQYLATDTNSKWECSGTLHAAGTWVQVAAHITSANDFAGASIIEKANAAIAVACNGTTDGVVGIPVGVYTASAPSAAGWTANYFGGASGGILLPNHCSLVALGAGHAVINVTRASADPDAIVVGNTAPNSGNNNLRVFGISINYTDNGASYGSWGAPFFCSRCSTFQFADFVNSGNPNIVGVRVVDSAPGDIGPGIVYVSTGPTTGYGNAAIGVSSTFGGTLTSPALPFDPDKVKVHDLFIYQVNDPAAQVSYVVGSQSNSEWDNIYISGLDKLVSGSLVGGTGFEFGSDNLGMLPHNIKVTNSTVRGTSGTILSGYKFDIENDTFTDGATLSISNNDPSQATVQGRSILRYNRVLGGGCISSNDGAFGTGELDIEDNVVTGSSCSSAAISVIGKGRGHIIKNNTVAGSEKGCINAFGADIIDGNVCKDTNLARTNVNAIVVSGPQGGSAYRTQSVFNNTVLDQQATYSTGTICTIAPWGVATTCPGTTVTSPYVLLTGGTWSSNWSNKRIWIGGVEYKVGEITDSTHLVLESTAAIAAGSPYNFYATTCTAYVLNNDIGVFAANRDFGGHAPGSCVSVQDTAGKTVNALFGNYFNPSYYIQGSGFTTNYDYRLNTHASTTVETNLNADMVDGAHHFTGSATLTFTAIAAQTAQEQNVTITGASTTNLGAACSPRATLSNANVSWTAWVSATNTVTVRVTNPTAASVTPSAVVWGCTVTQ